MGQLAFCLLAKLALAGHLDRAQVVQAAKAVRGAFGTPPFISLEVGWY